MNSYRGRIEAIRRVVAFGLISMCVATLITFLSIFLYPPMAIIVIAMSPINAHLISGCQSTSLFKLFVYGVLPFFGYGILGALALQFAPGFRSKSFVYSIAFVSGIVLFMFGIHGPFLSDAC